MGASNSSVQNAERYIPTIRGEAVAPLISCEALVPGEIVGGNVKQAVDDQRSCAICLGPLSRALVSTLPRCGHRFHGLCLASALHAAQRCPLCRCDVDAQVCRNVADALMSDAGSGASLAVELLMELRSRGQTPEPEVSDSDLIDALRRAVTKGDCGKIASIATFLGKVGPKQALRRRHSAEVRLAAVEALRALVPTFAESWPGLAQVVGLLQEVASEDSSIEVRCGALRALCEISRPGSTDVLRTIRGCLEETKAHPDIKAEAADALRVLAPPGDCQSARAALRALADPDYGVMAAGVAALRVICASGECGDLLSELSRLSTDSGSSEARCAALDIMAQIEGQGGSFGARVATIALQDPEESVRYTALACLRQLWLPGDAAAVKTIAAIAAGTACPALDCRLRCEALDLLPKLVNRPDKVARRVVLDAFGAAEESLRQTAAQTLKQVCDRGDPEAVDALIRYTDHPEADIQRLAVETLGTFAAFEDQRVKAVLARKAACGDDAVEYSAECALRYLH